MRIGKKSGGLKDECLFPKSCCDLSFPFWDDADCRVKRHHTQLKMWAAISTCPDTVLSVSCQTDRGALHCLTQLDSADFFLLRVFVYFTEITQSGPRPWIFPQTKAAGRVHLLSKMRTRAKQIFNSSSMPHESCRCSFAFRCMEALGRPSLGVTPHPFSNKRTSYMHDKTDVLCSSHVLRSWGWWTLFGYIKRRIASKYATEKRKKCFNLAAIWAFPYNT